MLRDEILGVRIPHSRYSSALLHVQCRREVPNGRSTLLQNQEEMRACGRSATFLFSPSLARRYTDKTAWVGWEWSFFSCLRKRISKVIDRLRVRNSPITASTGTRYTRCRVTLTSFPAYLDRSPEMKWRHSTLVPPRCSTRYSTRRKYQGFVCRSMILNIECTEAPRGASQCLPPPIYRLLSATVPRCLLAWQTDIC